MADIKNEARFRSDIPSDQWLQEKREDAELSGRNQFGVPKAFGPTTGRFDRNLSVSIEMLAVLPGERGEQDSVREDSLSYLRANWDKVSKEPLYVEIDPFGKPWVSEGNHRIMVAKEMGVLSLPTEVRYFGGGDRVAPADWAPMNLIAEDLKLGAANEVAVSVSQGEFVGVVMDGYAQWSERALHDEHARLAQNQHGGPEEFADRKKDLAEIRSELSRREIGRVSTNDSADLVNALTLVGAGAGVGVPLFQDSRGQFETDSLTLTLLSTADESTFIHEAGHFYFEVLADVAGQPGAPLGIRQDMDSVMDWLEVPGGSEAWKLLSMAEKRPYHEMFARGVEAYFMTGKAPVPEMDGVFSRFAKFLSNVYKSVTGLNVELTPSIVSVFDRLVAQSSPVDRQAVDGIQASLAAQLDVLDRFPADVNRDYAGMVANFYGAVAGAAEMSVADLAEKYPLQIRRDVHGLASGGDRADPAILHQPACVASLPYFAYKPQAVSRIVKEGAFSGAVLNVSSNGVVTQKINRDGDTVRHDLYALSKPVSVGSVVDIKYVGGVGVVGGQAVLVGVGR